MSEKVCCDTCKYVSGVKCLNPTGSCSRAVKGYPKWEPKETAKKHPATKTLLDEFAMAAMKIMAVAMDQGYWTPGDDPNAEIAESSYQMAKSMMAERARRDEMGNVKEVDEA